METEETVICEDSAVAHETSDVYCFGCDGGLCLMAMDDIYILSNQYFPYQWCH